MRHRLKILRNRGLSLAVLTTLADVSFSPHISVGLGRITRWLMYCHRLNSGIRDCIWLRRANIRIFLMYKYKVPLMGKKFTRTTQTNHCCCGGYRRHPGNLKLQTSWCNHNPSLITAAAQMLNTKVLVDDTWKQPGLVRKIGFSCEVVSQAFDSLAVSFVFKNSGNYFRSRINWSWCKIVIRHRRNYR